jgi:hypothetical protein
VRKTSHRIQGLEHLKLIQKKSFELKFMAEPACLGGAGLVGKADASQAAGAGRNQTPAGLSARRDDSHRPGQRGCPLGWLLLEECWKMPRPHSDSESLGAGPVTERCLSLSSGF